MYQPTISSGVRPARAVSAFSSGSIWRSDMSVALNFAEKICLNHHPNKFLGLAGFHAFQHGVATTVMDRGASITTVGAQLRHSDPESR